MKDSVKEIKLFDLEYNGEYLFVYSDKYNIFFFFLDHEDNKLYKITTDKFFYIEYIDEIETPSDFSKYKKIKFFKPFNNNNEYSFIGIIIFENVTYKFKIENNNKFIYVEESKFINNEGIINNLSCLNNIEIFNYIQKKNKLFLIGYDNEYKDYIYAIVNIEDNKAEKVYSLFSGYGDIIPLSINTDMDDHRVYIVGKTVHYDDQDKVSIVKPYFDSFILI